MNIVVIGGMGHIGSYLVPQLVTKGFDVTVVSRGHKKPYTENSAWDEVHYCQLDRQQDSAFNQKIAQLQADIVIDLIGFTLAEVSSLVEELQKTQIQHYLYCSSIWAHGRATTIPVLPNAEKDPLDEYGKQKYAVEKYLKIQYQENHFPATVIMPGQISGPGWSIINPLGNLNDQVFQNIACGKEIYLPNFGMETLHHVHAFDVAQVFTQAVLHQKAALGQSFHAVAKDSLTLYGYAQATYQFFKQTPKINFLDWDKWCQKIVNREEIDKTYYHIARSGQYSIENAQQLLQYEPRYTTWQTVTESLNSYLNRNIIQI